MKVELHTQTKEIKDGKLEKKQGLFTADLDMSLASQIRFEAKFPDLAQREDLYNYSKRISEIKEISAPVLISKMKMLYCWFDTDISFVDFLKLFDLTDEEYVKRLTGEIKTVFDLVMDGSAEKN